MPSKILGNGKVTPSSGRQRKHAGLASGTASRHGDRAPRCRHALAASVARSADTSPPRKISASPQASPSMAENSGISTPKATMNRPRLRNSPAWCATIRLASPAVNSASAPLNRIVKQSFDGLPSSRRASHHQRHEHATEQKGDNALRAKRLSCANRRQSRLLRQIPRARTIRTKMAGTSMTAAKNGPTGRSNTMPRDVNQLAPSRKGCHTHRTIVRCGGCGVCPPEFAQRIQHGKG